MAVSSGVVVRCVAGAALSGKTMALYELAREQAAEGKVVLFACASSAAAQEARDVLPPLCKVVTPLELALDVIERADGVRPSVLGPLDERVLLEDLKRTGIGQKRLAALLRFFERSFSDMADDNPSWIRTGEERLVLGALEESLGFCGGMLASQAPACAVRALRADEELRERAGGEVVIADDFHLMSRASQQLLAMLAGSLLAFSADDEPLGAPVYPAEEKCLDSDVARAMRDWAFSLNDDDAMSGVVGGVQADAVLPSVGDSRLLANRDSSRCVVLREVLPSLQEELAYVADCIVGEMAKGTSPGEVALMSENASWLTLAQEALRGRGVAVHGMELDGAASRAIDLRDTSSSEALVALRRVQANLGDEVALRTWCAFGDYLGNSVAIGRLRESGVRLGEALRKVDAGVLDGFDSADPLLAGILRRYRQACEHEAGGEKRLSEGVFVGSPRQAHGRRFRMVILGGMVASREDGRAIRMSSLARGCDEHACQRLLLQRVTSLAMERLIATGFEHCTPEEAEKLDVTVKRIRLLNREKICLTNPRL